MVQRDEKRTMILKRIVQLVFSVSAFSFYAWYSCQDESFKAYFSTILFSMFTHTLERKYMFLLCNAILAFVAKSSLSTSSPSAFDNNVESHEASNLSETQALASTNSLVAAEEEKKQEHCEEEVPGADEEQDDGESIEASIAEEEGRGRSGVMEIIQDYEVDHTTMAPNEELVNADELNRKFEEFIRKMKEEIKIEAQRQLIAV